jgi:hypothetical protein
MITTVHPLENSMSPLDVRKARLPIPLTSWNPGTPPCAAVRVPAYGDWAVPLSGYRLAMMVMLPPAVV